MSSQTYTVKECLHGYTNEALGTMCGHWKLVSGTKPGRIRAVEKVLMDPLHLAMAIALLDGPSLRLAHLIAERGLVDTADILSVPALYSRQKPELPLQRLAQSGLVLSYDIPSDPRARCRECRSTCFRRGGLPSVP